MKLILLLVAIYSLIFYQQYKIEKANDSVPGTKGSFQHIDLPDKSGNENAEMLIRNYYSGYRYWNTRKPAIAFAFHQ